MLNLSNSFADVWIAPNKEWKVSAHILPVVSLGTDEVESYNSEILVYDVQNRNILGANASGLPEMVQQAIESAKQAISDRLAVLVEQLQANRTTEPTIEFEAVMYELEKAASEADAAEVEHVEVSAPTATIDHSTLVDVFMYAQIYLESRICECASNSEDYEYYQRDLERINIAWCSYVASK